MITKNEIMQLLSSKDCVTYISQLSREELAVLFGEELTILRGYDQNNPHHSLDLLNHTLGVMSDIYAQQLDREDTLCLALSALLHDVGKPAVAKLINNRTVYYGHPLASRQIASKLLRVYGFTDEQSRRILFLITYHDAFINFKLPEELVSKSPHLKAISPDSVTGQLRHIRQESEDKYQYTPTMDDFRLLMKLCAADATAQAEIVCQDGRIIDTRSTKLERIHTIEAIIDLLQK